MAETSDGPPQVKLVFISQTGLSGSPSDAIQTRSPDGTPSQPGGRTVKISICLCLITIRVFEAVRSIFGQVSHLAFQTQVVASQ